MSQRLQPLSPDAPALDARGLHVSYGDTPILRGVDLSIAPGEVVALCGPNGSGKSTLLKSFAKLVGIRAGTIAVEGKPLQSFSRRTLARRLAVLPQHPVVPEGVTVRELVELGRHPYRRRFGGGSTADDAAVAEAMARADVETLAQRRVETLSGGERQRAWLALVLAQQCRVLLLDEPTTFLDPHHQLATLALVKRLAEALALTVVWVLHDLNQAAAYSHRLILMQEGRIEADGAPEEVLTEALVRRVFRLESVIIPHPQTGRPLCVPKH